VTTATIAVDTSVAVPLLSQAHALQPKFSDWAHGKQLWLAGHAATETYSVLTRLPSGFALGALDAVRLLDESFVGVLTLPTTATAYRELARLGVTGGAVYDGLVALAAKEHAAVLATHDARALSTYERLSVDVTLVGTP
jgi:predicted nucleic acid-binding protein